MIINESENIHQFVVVMEHRPETGIDIMFHNRSLLLMEMFYNDFKYSPRASPRESFNERSRRGVARTFDKYIKL